MIRASQHHRYFPLVLLVVIPALILGGAAASLAIEGAVQIEQPVWCPSDHDLDCACVAASVTPLYLLVHNDGNANGTCYPPDANIPVGSPPHMPEVPGLQLLKPSLVKQHITLPHSGMLA
jgi:hypothetical protein